MSKRLIVGIDGSPESEAAMAWALEEADRRELEVALFNTPVLTQERITDL